MTTVAALLVVLRWDGRHEVDPAGRGGPVQARPGAAAAALADLVQAVDRRDHQAVPGASAAVMRVVHNARVLDVRDFGLRYVDEVGTPGTDGSWFAEVEATWRFAGFDRRPSRAQVIVRFAPAGGGVVVREIARVVEGATSAPVWLGEEVVAARSGRVLVLVAASTRRAAYEARALAADARRGIATVQASLPAWPGRAVVEQPGSAGALDRALGAQPGTYAAVAAVTAPVGGPSGPVHVFVNPDLRGSMAETGRRVVMAHELVHLATDASRSGAEPWLVEGFADYVALRGSTVRDEVALGRAIEDARRNGTPGRLPGPEEFATTSERLQLAYEHAWLACRLVAARLGHEGLVELYEDAATGQDTRLLLAGAGLPYEELLGEWRSVLRALAA